MGKGDGKKQMHEKEEGKKSTWEKGRKEMV